MRLAIGGGPARFDIEVYDSADVEVTGLVTGNFTKYLTIDGVTDAGTVTVTEIANGRYTVTFTAPAVTAGNVKYVRCRVLHATHAPRGFAEDFEVYNVNVLSGVTQTGDTYALANGANGFVATKVDTAAILVDTAVIGATGGGLTSLAQASVCTEARLAELDAANLPTDVAAVKSKTDQLTFPGANRVDVNIAAVNNNTGGVAGLYRAMRAITIGTVGSASTTTSIVTSSMTPAAAVTDQFKGLILRFDKDTTTTNLRGQATDITASTSAGVLTCTALTTAPVSGDTFTIE